MRTTYNEDTVRIYGAIITIVCGTRSVTLFGYKTKGVGALNRFNKTTGCSGDIRNVRISITCIIETCIGSVHFFVSIYEDTIYTSASVLQSAGTTISKTIFVCVGPGTIRKSCAFRFS